MCSVCLRCKSCNGVDVSIFVGNLPLCKSCFLLRQKGNYCPLCQRCYEDDDYDSKMMECGQCKCWVHAKCEGLSDEKYQVLSFLPESVEYVCRMCCVMPPAPWWLAVEAELKSGYLGVLKALSKNRKACTMLKWSPRKQCTCRQVDYVSRALDFEETKCTKGIANDPYTGAENSNIQMKEENKLDIDKAKDKRGLPACISQRKTSIEVINHPTESLKLTLKIMKGADIDVRDKINTAEMVEDVIQVHGVKEKYNNKENTVRVKKCPLNEKNSENFTNFSDYNEESQISSHCFINKSSFEIPQMEVYGKKAFPSASNRPSDSGLGSTDDELKGNCFTDEKSSKLDDLSSRSHRGVEAKSNCDTSVSFLEEKRECFCFLEVDSYHSRSKPFSPNLMSIKKKVTTSEYSSLHQFHQDMERMIATTHSVELMDLYHQTIKEVFPWFDPKFSKVQSSSQKVLGTTSLDSTPVKNTPVKNTLRKECTVLKEKLYGKSLDYFYSDNIVKDERICLMCKTVGDGPPGDTGRLLYCGQNEWVHCNCALWSGEVFEEIDGSLQNVHSAISRGRSIRCPECNLKGASIGCCARNCQETYHFSCARKIGCVFMDDKTMYCPAHIKESIGKLVQNEKEFEIRRPVYVELDKRKMKNADSGQIRFAVGALQVNNLGRFVVKLSDQTEAIIPEQFNCTRLYWSCYEPWRIVKYHFTIRLVETEDYGVDMGVNLTIDHSLEPHLLELKLKQLWHFQHFNTFLETSESLTGENLKEKNKLSEFKTSEGVCKLLTDEKSKIIASSRTKKDQKVAKKVLDQFDSKEDENCLSDNQNTADLLPPDIEEAIFKDLPHDILDGISMQDIFMDIKNDSYENGLKDSTVEDPSEVEDNFENSTNKSKKNEFNADSTSQNEFWVDTNECRSEIMEESFTVSKLPKDLKKIKIEGSSNQPNKKSATLKTYQKSCNLNWNCKTDGPNNKWKKNSKCHVTVNLLEPQERGNMLQELKFTDGLVAISTGAICTMKDFKSRLEDNKRSIQEEGKENKCLSWQTRLQPRLLQVDGGVDSSSSGSEAGESPQRLVDDNINSKSIVSSQSLPFLDSPMYSLSRPKYSEPTNLSYSSNYSNASRESYDHSSNRLMNNLPQLDGAGDFYSDLSDSEEIVLEINKLRKRRKHNDTKKSIYDFSILPFKVNQCDGGMDSEFEEEELTKCSSSDDITCSTTPSQTEDEPVKCNKCHCTYRTNNSYQRHLESCSSDFILSSSEGEMSDEESPKKHLNSASLLIKSDDNTPSLIQKTETENSLNNIHTIIPHPLCSLTKSFNDSFKNTRNQSPDDKKNLETKKDKTVKRTCVKKKLPTNTKKAPNTGNLQQMQQILVQQPNTAPALIVQDITAPNVLPTAFIDSTAALGYLTAVDSQNPFGKTHLIAAPNGIISGNFQFSSAPEAQLLGGLCLNSQNVQTNLPGFIIQQPHTPGTLLSSQQCPVMMSGEQMMLGSTGLYDVIQDPRTGGMFLTSYNQPVFYNMETIVSNTVMQTNQFVSNDLATTFSQTSTQIFQASEMEQVVNIPSNYIVVGPNPPTTDRYFSTEDLICIQSPQTLISNQNPIQITNQSLFNTSFPAVQAFDTDAKLMPTPINPLRCIQPICPSVVVSKITSTNANVINHPVSQVFQKSITPIATQPNSQIKVKQVLANKTQISNQCRSVPMMQPSTIKLTQDKIYERVGTPKLKVQQAQPGSRALVDYINNFRSDICDIVPTPLTPVPNAKHQNPDTNDPAAIKTIAADYSPPGINSKNCLSDKHPVPSKSKLSTSPIFFSPPKPRAEFKVPAEVSKKSKRSLPVGTFLSSTESSATESVQKTLKSIVLSSNASTLEKPDNSNQTSLKTVCSSKNQHSQMNAIGQGVKPELSQEIKTENVELPSVPLPKVLINRTNSFSFDRDVKKSLSMPRLDDSPASDQEEQLKVINEALSPKEKTTTEVLPLQENHHAINASGKSNSVQKVLSSDNKNLFPVSDENNKLKKKANLVVQNTLTSDISAKSENEVKEKTVFDALKMERAILLSPKKREEKGPKLIFEVISDDGFKSSSASMAELWANICDSVQEMRATVKIPVLPVTRKGHEVLGMHNHGLQHCLEQLRGVEQCSNYKCKYFFKDVQKNEDEEEEVKENLSGCARTEKFINRKEYDMFAWLASKHRELPKLTETAEETLSTIR